VIGLGAASWLAGIVLTGAAAWLLVRASTLPPVLTLSVAVVLVRGSAIARPLLRYLERLAAHDLAFGRLGERRAGVYADLIPRVPGPRQTRRGELLTRVVDDVDAMVDGLLRGRFPAAAAGVALGIVSAVAIVLLPAAGPAIAAGLLLAAVLAPAVAAHQAGRREDDTAQARAALNDAVVETIDGLEDLATGGPGALAVPERRSRALAGQESRAARSAGLAAAIGHLGWGVAVVGTALALGGLSHEWSAVVLLALVALGEPVMSLPDTAVARRRAAGAQQRLAELTAQPPSATVNHDIDPAAAMTPQPTAQPASTMTLQQTEPTARPKTADVRIRGLVAGWDLDRPPALRGLDLDLPAGSRTAVLGPSGGGKSTLAAVLARLLDPRAGTVTLGGVDLLTLDDREVRRRIGLVSEDADHIFASTVRENLRLARTDADDEALHRVLKRVGLDLDLDRWLGTGGGTVSGGQRKRLATARALLADPELLILDEPTEGLDQAGAEALMADLLAATEGRTVLLLSHRTEGLDRIGEIHRLENHALTTADA
jgi:ATP-binding cassette subfamily C protein CydCD